MSTTVRLHRGTPGRWAVVANGQRLAVLHHIDGQWIAYDEHADALSEAHGERSDALARLTPEQKDDALAYLAGFAYQLSTDHVHGPNKSRWLTRMADTCPPAADLIRAVGQ